MIEAPIRVDGLTRHYGKHRGISDLTFEVEEGEIVFRRRDAIS